MTRTYRRTALVVAVVSCLLAAAGCGTTTKKSGGNTGGAKPPAGGWPQATNGELGKEMCGLLTDADFAKQQLDVPLAQDRTSDAANSVFCSYMLGDTFELYLQPTAEAAKLIVAARQTDDADKLKEHGFTSEKVTGTVAGADDSFVDLDPLGTEEFKSYEVLARRGALVVKISAMPDTKKPPADPKQSVAALAQLVLERVPELGKQDTGHTPTITYEVTGKGKADISYADFATNDVKELKTATLPWKIDVPFAVTSAQEMVALTVNAVSADLFAGLSCRISVNGKVVYQDDKPGGLTFCMSEYKLTD